MPGTPPRYLTGTPAVLESIQGVKRAEVSLEKAQATVTYDPAKADVNRMKEAVTDAGYQVA
jgi:copper chaperone